APAESVTLSTNNGTWTGLEPITFEYEWSRCPAGGGSCTPIEGAQAASYKATTADVAYKLKATVKAKNSLGSETASAESTPVEGKPLSPVAPIVTGEAVVGRQLVATEGSWRAFPTPAFGFEWQHCSAATCTGISGATSSTYLVAQTYVGEKLRAV